MKAQTVDVRESMGRILCCTIFRPGGKKLLAKGHVLSEEDVRLLSNEGMEHVWVTELEDGEVSEDNAVTMVASELRLWQPRNPACRRWSRKPLCHPGLLCAHR